MDGEEVKGAWGRVQQDGGRRRGEEKVLLRFGVLLGTSYSVLPLAERGGHAVCAVLSLGQATSLRRGREGARLSHLDRKGERFLRANPQGRVNGFQMTWANR